METSASDSLQHYESAEIESDLAYILDDLKNDPESRQVIRKILKIRKELKKLRQDS